MSVLLKQYKQLLPLRLYRHCILQSSRFASGSFSLVALRPQWRNLHTSPRSLTEAASSSSSSMGFLKSASSVLRKMSFGTKNDPALDVRQGSPTTADDLKALNDLGLERKALEAFESGEVNPTEDSIKQYIRAAVACGKLNSINLVDLLTKAGNITTSSTQSTGAGAQSSATTVLGAIGPDGSIPVRIVTTSGQRMRTWIPVIIVGGLLCYLAYDASQPSSSSSSSSMSSILRVDNTHDRISNVTSRFADVRGADEAKAELVEVVEYLKDPIRFARLGAKLPKGMLLVGEPGTGKTLLARAVAGEAGVPFYYISASAFDEMLVGVGSRRVRNLFADAKQNAPCIIFIDEIDAVGQSRSASYKGGDSGTLNQMLTEMDGFSSNEGIVVLAATNIPERLDPALTRPGRFDKQVVVPVPDVHGRKQIIDFYLEKIVSSEDVCSDVLARGTPSFTGADLANLINIAALKATSKGLDKVDHQSLEEAKDDVLMGVMRKSGFVSEETRRLTAYHEAGHALVALHTSGTHPLHKASIIQRGSSLGVTMQLPDSDQLSYSRKQMLARIAVCMGGRAAEEVAFGHENVTSGASSDFKQATMLAKNMIQRWGMSEKVGFVFSDQTSLKPSAADQNVIDTEVRELLQAQYNAAKTLLVEHEDELDLLANSLLDNEELSGDEIKQVLLGNKITKIPVVQATLKRTPKQEVQAEPTSTQPALKLL